jgi:uncharacterized membrane protein YbhN (UPF0104 family)
MTVFLYAVGSIVYQVLTLWLAMLTLLLLWDVAVSKLRGKRDRRRLDPLGSLAARAIVLTGLALIAAAVDLYLLTPALGTGINFFFAG